MGDIVSKQKIFSKFFFVFFFVFYTQKVFMLLNEAHLNVVQIPQVGELF